jgi:tetratricopeptide (TPR) repeat protein
MNSSGLLHHLCNQYQQAIATLIAILESSKELSKESSKESSKQEPSTNPKQAESDPSPNWNPEQVLELLQTRDRIQHLIDQLAAQPAVPEMSPNLWLKLAEADTIVRDTLVPHLAKYKPLHQWRDNFNPPDRHWWWFPPTPADPNDPFSWLWGGCTIAVLTVSVALAQDIATRFLTGAPGLWSSIGAIAPVALALLASGGALTQLGQQILESILAHRGPAKYHWPKLKFGLAALLMIGLFVMHGVGLSQLAQTFNRTGETLYEQGEWSSAQTNFERALSLNPDFPTAQFNLGVLYEDYQRFDDAQTEYLKAVQGGYLPALNNLARLYIQAENYSQAAPLLREALSRPELTQQEPELVYVLRKNLGWVRLEQNRWLEAETELLEAIRIGNTLKPPRPDAHCLLAQVLQKLETEERAATSQNEERGDRPAPPLSQATQAQWTKCLQSANRPEYDHWQGMAQTALTQAEAASHAQ